MKRKLNLKMIILTSIFAVSLLFLGTTNSKAVLQSNPTTHKSPANKSGSTWLTKIRQMETVGQTMGLSETLNGLNATSESNNIDVHMMLPSEYWTVAILSASGYGNQGKLRDETDPQKRTTTGNSTGVYFTGNRWEWLAYAKESPYTWNKYYLFFSRSDRLSTSWSYCSPTWHGGGIHLMLNGSNGEFRVGTGVVCDGNGLFSWGESETYGSSNTNSWENQLRPTRGSAISYTGT